MATSKKATTKKATAENIPSDKKKPKDNKSIVYIARQPIFNTAQSVYAYELLYRDTERNAYNPQVDSEYATGTVISESILNFGMGELTNGKKAFVNFTEGYLLNQAAYLLNPEQFVIEILENVVFTIEVIDALYTLKASGFTLALDDYTGAKLTKEILSLIDIIKIDFRATDSSQRAVFSPALRKAGKTLLAEKVETTADVNEAQSLGCQLFQGFYFSKPIMMKTSSMDISSASYVKLSKELSAHTVNLDRIAWIINWDAHLTYKLLKRMKTLQYYRGNTITSIKRALVMMGDDEVRRWIMLILMRGLLSSKADEMIRTALIRAFMCEKLARETNYHRFSAEAFSTGMLSILPGEALHPDEAFRDIQIPQRIKDALSGRDNVLRRFLDITVCYENGDWTQLEQLITSAVPCVNLRLLPGLYLLSVSAADEMLSKEK